jgi:hypothetical protein
MSPKAIVQSEKSDLWRPYSTTADRRRGGYEAESAGDLKLVITRRPRPTGTKNYWSLPQGSGSHFLQTYGTGRESSIKAPPVQP